MTDNTQRPDDFPIDDEALFGDLGNTGDDQRVSRLSGGPASSAPPAADSGEQDAVVREYERRYSRQEADALPEKPKFGEKPKMDRPGFGERAGAFWEKSRRGAPLSYNGSATTSDERLWAALAHASIWLTVLAGAFSGGMLLPLTVFIPLVIYFVFRTKSNFVAFHSLQAFVLQLVATIGVAVFGLVGVVVAVIALLIIIVLCLVLIGFVLLPVWLGVTALGGLVVSLLPVAGVILSTIAAIETYNGRDYSLPFIGRFVDRQLAGSYLNTVA